MTRRSSPALVRAIALLFPLHAAPLTGLAQSLPEGFNVQAGSATLTHSANALNIEQTSSRAVLNWSSFNIDAGASVHFSHPQQQGTTLNIVDGTTASLVAGTLTADDSIYLINPHGLTITPSGKVDTGGAFVASTLSLSGPSFMNGGLLTFSGQGGDILNQGAISASDVVMLGTHVANRGTIVAPMGRVALGSSSHATLDLHGGGFLQVLAPATDATGEALVTNSGEIIADGGRVYLQAATAHNALREAVAMPGVVRAQSVSGSHGAIVFHGGDGGVVDVSGGTADVSPTGSAHSGGEIVVTAQKLEGGVSAFKAGPRGQFNLSVDSLAVVGSHASYLPPETTQVLESFGDIGFRGLLIAGSDVSITSRSDIEWSFGPMIGRHDIAAGANGQAGHMSLFAATDITLSGPFSTYNGDWSILAQRNASLTGSQFVNTNGHLNLQVGDVGEEVWNVSLPYSYSGASLTARIDPNVINYDMVAIDVMGEIDVAGTVTLSGHLRSLGGQEGVLRGSQVNWTSETNGGRLSGDELRFIENGVLTRFGRGGGGPVMPGVDALRLELGSNVVLSRLYGDADPDQQALGNQILSVAAHNTVDVGLSQPFGKILTSGSIEVTGPGPEAPVGDYTLSLSPSADIALDYNQSGGGHIGGDGGIGYWIDLSPSNTQGASANLQITPRPLSVEFLDPSYTYGEPEPALLLKGVVNNDVVTPLGVLNNLSHDLQQVSGGYVVADRVGAGSHTIGVSGIGGPDANNYSLDVASLDEGTLNIARRVVNYGFLNAEAVYSENLDIRSWLDVLVGDDVWGALELVDSQGHVVDHSGPVDVGEYQMRLFGLDGPAADNYELASSGNSEGTLTITPKPVTWHVNDVSSVYGTLAELGFALLDGVLPGDDVLAPVTSTSPLLYNSPVGRYSLKVDDLTGRSAPNYEIAVRGHTGGSLEITPRVIYWGTTGGISEYGTLASPSTSVVLQDVLSGDDVNAAAGLFDGMQPVVVSERLKAGTYTVRAYGLQGADAANYQLASSGNDEGEWQVTPRPLTWNVGADSISYGSVLPPNPYTLTGVLSGDTVDGVLRLFVDGEIVEPDGPRLPVGSYDVVVHTLAGLDAGNYTLHQSPDNVPGRLDISPLELTWTVNDGSVMYGQPLESVGYTLHNLLPGDQVDPVISARVTDYETRPDVGTWLTFVTALNGRDAANYRLRDPFFAPPGATGLVTVTPRPLSFQAGHVHSTYGDDVELTFNVTGLMEGDPMPVLEYDVTRDGQMFGTGYSSDGVFTRRLDAGRYTIEPRALRSLNGNFVVRNYTLSAHPLTRAPFIAGEIFVDPRMVQFDMRFSSNDQQQGSFNDHVVEYLTYAPQGGGARLSPGVYVDGVLPADEVHVQLAHPEIPVSSLGYYESGTYTWRVDGLSGADAANYAVGLGTNARLHIIPRTLSLSLSAEPVEYGSAAEAKVDWELAEHQPYRDVIQDALDNEVFGVASNALGFVVEDEGREFFYPQLSTYTPVGRYKIASNPHIRVLAGVESFNFEAELRFGPRDYLTINPKELTAIPSDQNLIYGEYLSPADVFALDGHVDGNIVSLDNSFFTTEGLPLNAERLLDAGDYVMDLSRMTLTGVGAENYSLPPVTANVRVDPKQLYIEQESSVHYGQFNRSPPLKGVVEENAPEFFDRSDVRYVLLDDQGNRVPANRQPEVGNYTLRVEFSSYLDRVLRNYQRPPVYEITVEPRPLTVLATSYLTYGDTHAPPYSFYYERPDEDLPDRLIRDVGVLPDDEVAPEFRVYSWAAGAEAPESIFDEYLPAGNYATYITGLSGRDAENYTFADPAETAWRNVDGVLQPLEHYLQSDLTIKPRPLSPAAIQLPVTTTYGDAAPLAEVAGVLPNDELWFVGRRGDTPVQAEVNNGVIWDVSTPEVGTYNYNLTALRGPSASNYIWHDTLNASSEFVPREIHYQVESVVGHYGNYAACLDPADAYVCSYKVNRDGVAQPDIYAPLALGKVNFFNMLLNDDVDGNVILFDPTEASTLTLDDKPKPGIYLQLVDGLTGQDAHNYRIAQEDNVPGVLNMQPKWIEWRTYDGFYSVQTGIVTEGSSPVDARIYTDSWGRQGIEPEHASGVSPVVKMFHQGIHEMEYDPNNVRTWAREVRSGIYSVVVVDLEGEYADYYRPLPPEFLTSRMGFFHSTSFYNEEMEINAAIVEERNRQFLEEFGIDFSAYDNLLEDSSSEDAQEGDTETVVIVENGDSVAEGSDEAAPDAVNTDETDETNSVAERSDDDGDAGTDDSSSADEDNLAVIHEGYADVLFDYGVTGVTLEAVTGGGIEIEYEIGPGYVAAGADASAEGRLQFTYTKVQASGSARAGVDAVTGVSGSLGDLGRGTAELTAKANAFANATFSYGYEGGRLTYKTETMTGAGAQASTGFALAGNLGAANFKTTVYSPGTVGAAFGATGGYDDGVLSFNIEMSLGLGLFGGSVSFGGAINLQALLDGLEDAGRWLARAVTELGCAMSIGNCSSPTPDEIYQQRLDSGREVNRVAESWGHANVSPAERFAYLKANPEWALDDLAGREQEANREFFRTYASMLDDLREFEERQIELKQRFEDAMASGDGALAARTMSEMDVYYGLDVLLNNLNAKGEAIGVGFRVVRGELVSVRAR